jgi:hypothetical protein
LTWCDESGVEHEDYRLGAVSDTELGEEPVHVCLDGGFADEELAGDVGVRPTRRMIRQ